jgi:hypothetical protein
VSIAEESPPPLHARSTICSRLASLVTMHETRSDFGRQPASSQRLDRAIFVATAHLLPARKKLNTPRLLGTSSVQFGFNRTIPRQTVRTRA